MHNSFHADFSTFNNSGLIESKSHFHRDRANTVFCANMTPLSEKIKVIISNTLSQQPAK